MKAIFRLAGMAVVAVLLLASCSKNNSNLLTTIPADCPFVAKVNLNKTNIKELPERFFGDLAEDEGLKEAVDLDNVVVTMDDKKNVAIQIVEVKDESKLTKLLESKGLKSVANAEVKDSKTWEGEGLNVVLKDGIARFSFAKTADINKFILAGESAKQTIADCSGVADALCSDHMINLSLSTKKAAAKDGENKQIYTVYGMDIADKLTGTFKSMYADGSSAEVIKTQPIDAAVIDYVPGNAMAVYALGINGKELTDDMLKVVLNQVPLSYASTVSMAWEYLKRLSGTTMIAVTCNKPNVSADDIVNNPFDTLGLTVMAQMEKDDLESTLNQVKGLMAMAGLPFTDDGNGLYACTFGPMSVYFGIVDGYLTLSTSKPEKQSGHRFSKPGKVDAWLWMDLKDLTLPDGQKLGLQADCNLTDDKGTFDASFPGSGVPFMESLKKLGFSLD